jgi:coenzyme F420-reducing hydrogenase alpha subunit
MVCAMKKAGVLSILVAATVLAVAVIVEAQQPKKVPRIGYLSGIDAATETARAEAIRLAIRAYDPCGACLHAFPTNFRVASS